MTRNEAVLVANANLHWRGSAHHLLAIYRAFAQRPGHADYIENALSVMLRYAGDRRDYVTTLRDKIQSVKPARSATGRARYDAAVAAVDALDKLLDQETP